MVLEPAFANLNALDCRLNSDAMMTLRQNYAEGPVPSVMLGTQFCPSGAKEANRQSICHHPEREERRHGREGRLDAAAETDQLV